MRTGQKFLKQRAQLPHPLPHSPPHTHTPTEPPHPFSPSAPAQPDAYDSTAVSALGHTHSIRQATVRTHQQQQQQQQLRDLQQPTQSMASVGGSLSGREGGQPQRGHLTLKQQQQYQHYEHPYSLQPHPSQQPTHSVGHTGHSFGGLASHQVRVCMCP